MARVVFAIPDTEYEPVPVTLARLLDELDLLHRDGANYDGPAAAERIRRAAESSTDVAKLSLPEECSDAERCALARGLNHVWNTGQLTGDTDAQRLRSWLLTDVATEYEIRSLIPRAVKPGHFGSRAGAYEPGDRIVVRDGTAWKVVEVELGEEHPRLVLDRL